jgi:hypothetical protein
MTSGITLTKKCAVSRPPHTARVVDIGQLKYHVVRLSLCGLKASEVKRGEIAADNLRDRIGATHHQSDESRGYMA